MGTYYVDSMVRKEVVKKRGCSWAGKDKRPGGHWERKVRQGGMDMKLGNDL